MDATRWKRLSDLVQAAVEVEPEARRRLLEDLCVDDPALRAEAESLAAAHDGIGESDFLDQPPLDVRPDMDRAVGLELTGTQLGAYRVLHPVASGGMGAVYLAERADGSFEQHAAIKVLAGVSSSSALRRFMRERQILAALDHPNICRVLDGGMTPDGRPWFAMPFLEDARTLSAYCAEQRLDLAGRIRLFQAVCAGVDHAHRNLVVHGDLKPGNILVSAGSVRIVDFGIARMLDPTATGGQQTTQGVVRPLTPEYASPEQIHGEPPTILSDIYSLGVVLYELLSGARPYALDGVDLPELLRRVGEVEPPRPSQRVAAGHAVQKSELHGDLDNIIGMAIAKEPARRYASAAELSDDLQRHLDGHPVRARAQTLPYQLSRLMRRHRLATAGLFTGILGLVLLATGTSLMSLQLARQADVLRAERARAVTVSEFMTGLFEQANPEAQEGVATSVSEMLERGYRHLTDDGSPLQPTERAAALTALGASYQAMALNEQAAQALSESVALYQSIGSPSSGWAESLLQLSHVQFRNGEYAQAEASVRQALAIIEQMPEGRTTKQGSYLNTLALTLRRQNNMPEAIEVMRRAVAANRVRTDLEGRRSLATSLNNLGDMLHAEGDLEQAERALRESLSLFESTDGPDHIRIAYLLNSFAALKARGEDFADAVAMLDRSRGIAESVLGDGHPFIGVVNATMADIEVKRGRDPEAAAAYARALAVFRRTLPPTHDRLIFTLQRAAEVEKRLGHASQADALLSESTLAQTSDS